MNIFDKLKDYKAVAITSLLGVATVSTVIQNNQETQPDIDTNDTELVQAAANTAIAPQGISANTQLGDFRTAEVAKINETLNPALGKLSESRSARLNLSEDPDLDIEPTFTDAEKQMYEDDFFEKGATDMIQNATSEEIQSLGIEGEVDDIKANLINSSVLRGKFKDLGDKVFGAGRIGDTEINQDGLGTGYNHKALLDVKEKIANITAGKNSSEIQTMVNNINAETTEFIEAYPDMSQAEKEEGVLKHFGGLQKDGETITAGTISESAELNSALELAQEAELSKLESPVILDKNSTPADIKRAVDELRSTQKTVDTSEVSLKENSQGTANFIYGENEGLTSEEMEAVNPKIDEVAALDALDNEANITVKKFSPEEGISQEEHDAVNPNKDFDEHNL